MKRRLTWLIPAGLAVTMGLGLAWQRLNLGPVRAELEVLRDRQGEASRLRAEQARLRVQQVPDAELERLRSDRAAIRRLQSEVSAVRTSAEVKQQAAAARAAERFAIGQAMPAGEWRNAGAATPASALETVLWAAAGGEVAAFARLIQFDVAGRRAAEALYDRLPPAEKARHAGPAHLLAFLSIRDVPVGTATVESWPTVKGEASAFAQPVGLSLRAEDGKRRTVTLVFQRVGEEWKLRATEAAVAKYAAALQGR